MPPSRSQITTWAQELAFSEVRYAALENPTPHFDAYARWLRKGQHGEMDYLARGQQLRRDPSQRLPSAKTALVLALHHAHNAPPDPGGLTGRVARYAWGRDYHNLIGKRLRKLRSRLREAGVDSWGGVDTAPILERSWASAAGLGFGGKNCVQILPAKTSWMFLAVLFLDIPVEPDPPLRDHCGRCTRCLVACPTDAFEGPRELDARKCIAYWTIEAQGLPPRHLRPHFGRWVFGCDICQEVCPHNAAPKHAFHDDLAPRNAWLDLPELLETPDEALMERFLGTPIRRPKGHGIKRNALITLANLADPAGLPAIELGMAHEHAVVRAAATWALGQLGAPPAVHHRAGSELEQAELDALRQGPQDPTRDAS